MRIAVEYARRPNMPVGDRKEFSLRPICRACDHVAGYEETLSIEEECGYSGRLNLVYRAEVIAWDSGHGFARSPAKAVMRCRYGGASWFEAVEIPEDGITVTDVSDCIAIEVNGRTRYEGDGKGGARIVTVCADDDGEPQAEKSFDSLSDVDHTRMVSEKEKALSGVDGTVFFQQVREVQDCLADEEDNPSTEGAKDYEFEI